MARRAARRRGQRAVCEHRDPAAGAAAPTRGRAGDRGGPGRRSPRRGDRRARVAGRRRPATRAAARPAHAGALPLRPAGGGAEDLPRGARVVGRADRRGARARAAAPARSDLAPGSRARAAGHGDGAGARARRADTAGGPSTRPGMVARAVGSGEWRPGPGRNGHRPPGDRQDSPLGRAGVRAPRTARRDGLRQWRRGRCGGSSRAGMRIQRTGPDHLRRSRPGVRRGGSGRGRTGRRRSRTPVARGAVTYGRPAVGCGQSSGARARGTGPGAACTAPARLRGRSGDRRAVRGRAGPCRSRGAAAGGERRTATTPPRARGGLGEPRHRGAR